MLKGKLDDIYIYERALNSTEVYALYTNTDGPSMPDNFTSIDSKQGIKPLQFKLISNYPNPFYSKTKINFTIPFKSRKAVQYPVSLQIFNIKGQLIKTLINHKMSSGLHSITWDGTDNNLNIVKTGTYIYKIISGGFVQSKKMFFIK